MTVDSDRKRSSERIARAAALLRQRGFIVVEPRNVASAQVVIAGPLSLDVNASTLTYGDTVVKLTPFKFLMLRALMEAEGAWVSRRALRKLLWGDAVPASDALAVHMHFLREQLARCVGKDVIQSTRIRGFRLAFEVFDEPGEDARAPA